MRCNHAHKAMARIICSDGREQILEQCLDCGANVRGPGVWVARAEVRDPDSLPVLRDYRRKAVPQRGLFDTEGT